MNKNFNTIKLLKGYMMFQNRKNVHTGCTIFEVGCNPGEIKRWTIDQIEEAKEELKKYNCEYAERREIIEVTEYALEYCQCDEDGDFVMGSDYDFADVK